MRTYISNGESRGISEGTTTAESSRQAEQDDREHNLGDAKTKEPGWHLEDVARSRHCEKG